MFRILASVILGLALMPAVQAKDVNDIEVADSIQVADKTLTLNGAGVRSKFFLDLYVGALYLSAKSSDADTVIAADEAMTIRLYITSSVIDGEKMSSATLDGFVKSTGGNLAPIQKEVDSLISQQKAPLLAGLFCLTHFDRLFVEIYDGRPSRTPADLLERYVFLIIADDPYAALVLA